uniref:Globin domain-containing protein n=1 Tax=Timema poppense TaxID=170557 RepID=A0A7R9DJC2_TIMPO|nr:unnamed protein product [Timema poppensis]
MEPRHPRSTYKLKVPVIAESSVSLHSSVSDDGSTSTDATGLSPYQKKLIKDSWKRVRKDLTENGRNLFIEYVHAPPGALAYFLTALLYFYYSQHALFFSDCALLSSNLGRPSLSCCLYPPRLFSVYPQYKSFFSELKKIPVAELKDSNAIYAHSNIVMYSLSAMIEQGLDDPEALQAQLVKMARTHARKKIKEVHFQNFSGVFMTFLRKMLGREMNTPLENSWNSFLDKMGSIVKPIQDNETDD